MFRRLRLRLAFMPPDSEEREAIVIQLAWHRYCEALAKTQDALVQLAKRYSTVGVSSFSIKR